MNQNTADTYCVRLRNFERFILKKYNENVDSLVSKLTQKLLDPYEILTSYCIDLQTQNISTLTLKHRIVTAKNFLEFNDVEISPRKFSLKVRLPRSVRKNIEALSKEEVIDILNVCSDIRLKTFVMFLASTGCRAGEAASIRFIDLDFSSHPSKVYIRGEHTKTKTDRVVFLTDELVQQLKSWIEFKYRTRRICSQNKKSGKYLSENRTPQRNDDDLIFTSRKYDSVEPKHIYMDLCHHFEKTLDRMGKGAREHGNKGRRKITFHSFRRFVKTTISDLGYQDFSEFMIGHAGSTYWRKKDSEKGELFKKVEPYLTYLNIHSLERQGADIQSKIEELEVLNVSLRERDKMKDDIISGLSDKLITLSERMEAIERIRV
jgi:integrase